MRHDEGMRMSDGAELALTRYEAHGPRAVLCGLHGVGEHAGRYEAVAARWNASGMSLRMLDYRGHGRSPGKRGDTPYARTAQDATELLAVSAQAGLPVLLYGHSFGGGLALSLLLTQPLPIRAAIVTSPWLRLVKPVGALTAAALGLLCRAAPGLTLSNGLDAAGLCGDREQREAYTSDPLVHDRISLSMALGAHRAGQYALAHAARLNLSLLLLHGGGDPICSAQASREFTAAAGEKCTYHEYPAMLHELHHESVREDAFARQLRFVEEILRGQD